MRYKLCDLEDVFTKERKTAYIKEHDCIVGNTFVTNTSSWRIVKVGMLSVTKETINNLKNVLKDPLKKSVSKGKNNENNK